MEISVVKLNTSNLDSSNYIGDNFDISYSMRFGEPWIRWGVKNNLPNYLLALFNNSPTSSSLLSLKIKLVAGDGFITDGNLPLREFIENNDMNEVWYQACFDKCIFNGYSLDIIYDTDGAIADIGHITLPSLRPENSIKPDLIYCSRDWMRRFLPGNNYFTIPLYTKKYSGNQRECLYDFGYFPNNCHLPMESYRSALKYIELEKELGIFHLAGVTNGLVSSGYFTINDNPNKEEKEKFEQDIRDKFTGVENSARFMVFYDSDGKNVTYVPLKSDNNADIYKTLNEICVQKICQGHNLSSPTLAGLPGDNSIFTNGLSTAHEYFSAVVIEQIRKPVLLTFAKLFKRMGLIKSIDELKVKNLNPLQFKYDSNVLLSVLTKDELRASMGFAPLPNGEGASAGNAPIQTQIPNQSPLQIAPANNKPSAINQPNTNKIIS